jgi:diguanylate cyclase (GGDEF)-like protein
VAVTARDISAVKRAEAVLRDLAVRDDLTGLLNRRGFREMAEQEVRIARRHARRDAVLCLDLTGFKQINDTYGHTEGDRALAAVAVILRSTVRDGDLVARIGGDEFVIYAAGLRVEESGSMVARLRGALAEDNARAAARGRPYAIQTGIGAVELRPGEDLDAALARADAELYADKGTRGARLLPVHSSA